MQRLYFVRHGQTEFNLENRVQGAVDSPLLPQSLVDAEKTGMFLKDSAITRIVASPQLRAFQTAKLIEKHLPNVKTFEIDDRLREMEYGEWEGLSIDGLAETHPDLFHALRKEPHTYDPSSFHGETYQHLFARGKEVIQMYAEKYPEEEILFAGHSIHFMTTLLGLSGTPLADIRKQPPLANTSITTLLRDDESYTIENWNGIEHLLDGVIHFSRQ